MKNSGYVEKAWGYEIIWSTNDKYCGKLLCFSNPGNSSSMHYHKNKDESWFVNEGEFTLRYIETTTGEVKEKLLRPGDTWRNEPLQPHQLIALKADSVIFEVSTEDDDEDTYRILPSMANLRSDI